MSLTKSASAPQLICSVDYVLFNAVAGVLKVGESSVVVNLGTNTWKRIYSTPASISYSEKQNDANEGTSYSKELSLFYPGNEQASQEELTRLQKKGVYLVKFNYQDGTSKIIGTLENPAQLRIDFKSDSKTGFVALFYNVSEDRALFYYSSVEAVPEPLPEEES